LKKKPEGWQDAQARARGYPEQSAQFLWVKARKHRKSCFANLNGGRSRRALSRLGLKKEETRGWSVKGKKSQHTNENEP